MVPPWGGQGGEAHHKACLPNRRCSSAPVCAGRRTPQPLAWEHNLPANRMYPALGYRYAGAAEFFFMGFVREILNCYEKAL